MTRPLGASSEPTTVRRLSDPVRSLQDALMDITNNLQAELSTQNLSERRRAEICDRLRLIQTVAAPRRSDDR